MAKKKTSKHKPGTAGAMLDYFKNHPPVGPKIARIESLSDPGLKIVVAVAEIPSWFFLDSQYQNVKHGGKKLECGRAAAQACHAVSKLKLSWASRLLYSGHGAPIDNNIINRLEKEPITTIIVKARDSEELLHIANLAYGKNLHVAEFRDENKQFYGTEIQPLTAVAIGPYAENEFDGITDYLPLWKCACDPVS